MAGAPPHTLRHDRSRRGGDRRLDDRARSAVDGLARALLVSVWRANAGLLPVAAPAGAGGDAALDDATAVLLGDRAVADSLRRIADLHAAAGRLLARVAIDARHSSHFSLADPLDILAADDAGAIASAAARVRQAEAEGTGAFGSPAPTAAMIEAFGPAALCALGAVLRRSLEAAERIAIDEGIEAILSPAGIATEPSGSLVDALAGADRLDHDLLLDLLEAGHVRVWLAGAARLLGRSADRMEPILWSRTLAPALATLLRLSDRVAARMLLLLARATSADEDRAAALAVEWLEAFRSLSEGEAAELLTDEIRSPGYAAAIARAECLA